MSWFGRTEEDDAIFNGYVIKIIEEKKHDLQTVLYDVQRALDDLDGLTSRLMHAKIDSDASARCEHKVSDYGYRAHHDLTTALAAIAEMDRTISYDLGV